MLIYPCGNRVEVVPGDALYMMFANNEPERKTAAFIDYDNDSREE